MATSFLASKAEEQLGPVPTATHIQPKYRDEKMKANVWYGKEDVRIEERNVPDVTDPEDAVIQITGTTVCGSDLHLYHGEILELQKGDILGHECMGKVEKVGSAVANIKPGDRVVCSFNIGCGSCDYCKQGLMSACDRTNSSALMEKMYGHRIAGVLGYSHFLGGYPGAQAEWLRMPFADFNTIKIPDGIPDEEALYLSDIIGTSYHAVREGQFQEGDVVGVWGLGPVGQLVAQWLRVLGARRIFAVDCVPERLELAKQFGVEPINFEVDKNVVDKIFELHPKGLDMAIDCAGFRYAKSATQKVQRSIGAETDTSDNLNEMILSTRKFGRISVIADYVGTCNNLNIGAVMEKAIHLIGCGQAPIQKYWSEILEKYMIPKKFSVLPILSHRFEIDQIPKVYKAFDKKVFDDAKGKPLLKTYIETRHSGPPAPGTPTLSTQVPGV